MWDPKLLLKREPLKLDLEKISSFLEGKVICITGAGGSIGSELAKQIATFKPSLLILIDHHEYALYQIEQHMEGIKIKTHLLDLCDGDELKKIFHLYRIDLLFHAAAFKHVPLVEKNKTAGVKNNIIATYELALLAREHKVRTFINISTDKALKPMSMMGMTKWFAEKIINSFAYDSQSVTRFSTVRFGNVLGSSGSVIPLFYDQLMNHKPLTITHPEAERYFMSIEEAVQLVLLSATLTFQGEIFALVMGEPFNIQKLALQMKELLAPHEKTDIIFTGLRPGEKLKEENLISDDFLSTDYPQIKKTYESPWDKSTLDLHVRELKKLLRDSLEGGELKAYLQELYQKDSPR